MKITCSFKHPPYLAEILKREQMANKAHTDNPEFHSGYMAEVKALFSLSKPTYRCNPFAKPATYFRGIKDV